jgi:hypothetical protein
MDSAVKKLLTGNMAHIQSDSESLKKQLADSPEVCTPQQGIDGFIGSDSPAIAPNGVGQGEVEKRCSGFKANGTRTILSHPVINHRKGSIY